MDNYWGINSTWVNTSGISAFDIAQEKEFGHNPVEVLDDALDLNDKVECLYAALADLPDREYAVVVYRYGLYDDEYYTYEAIGQKIGLLPYSVQRIEQRALEKLKRLLDIDYAISAGWHDLVKQLLDLKQLERSSDVNEERGRNEKKSGSSVDQGNEKSSCQRSETGVPEVPCSIAS